MGIKAGQEILIALSRRRLEIIANTLEKALENGELPVDERVSAEGAIRQIRTRLSRSKR